MTSHSQATQTSSTPTSIPGPAGRLEIAIGREQRAPGASAPPALAILAHPHPLYGGNMDNAVVRRTAKRLEQRRIDTVRFNFRGVGNSDGEHDGGAGEVADLGAVAAWCREHFGELPLLLAGYSFGAATILRSERIDHVRGILLIAPPLSFYDLSEAPMITALRQPPDAVPLALIYGSNDELTAPGHRGQTASWPVQATQELQGVGHDLGAGGGADQRSRFDGAVDSCLDALGLTSANRSTNIELNS